MTIPTPDTKGGVTEIRELRYFAAVARAGNFGRAAQELRTTPPAVRQQIGRLEEELGSKLLIRHGRGVTLTGPGARLLERLDTILPLLAAPLEPRTALTPVPGTVSIGLPPEVGPLVVPPLVERLRQLWPKVILDVREAVSGALEACLLDGRVDIALLQDSAAFGALQIEPLLSEKPGLVVSPRSPLADSSAPLRLRDLAGLPLILPNPQHWIRRRLASAAMQRGLSLDPVFQTDSLPLALEMVRAGHGCSVLPSVAVRHELARGALVFRPISEPSLATTHGIAVRRAGYEPARGRISELLHGVIRTLLTDGAWTGAQGRAVQATTSAGEATDDGRAAPAWPGAWQLPGRAAQRSLEYLEGR